MVPVSLSGGVEPGARTGTSVGGEPVVVWRGADGRVRAWADQCPHRGMRLSFGFVRRDRLTCIYHGWSFESGPDGSAACVAIPAHPELTPPAKARVAAFTVAETLGLIWVGRPGDANPPPSDGTGPLFGVRSVTVPASAAALRAALTAEPPPGAWIVESGSGEPDAALITCKGTGRRVLAGIQDRGAGTASAHLVTTEPDVPARKALCRWAALVRDHLAAVALP